MRVTLAVVLLATLIPSAPARAQHGGHGPTPPPRPRTAEATAAAMVVYAPQESAGEVTLSLAPRWSDGKLVVLLAANTHSVDLAQIDLGQALRLVVNGETIAPSAADSLKGHHARARVVFPVPREPSQFTLEIRGVPDVETRTVQWPVKHESGH